jgi:formate hydrogenlyase transcriptional activator
MVQERRFRADLFYRLNVFPITLPPLRERGDDIALLTEYFVQRFARQQGKSIVSVPDRVIEFLKRHDWPGNIRELQNVIERGVLRTTGPALDLRPAELIMQHIGSAPISADAEQKAIRKLVDAEWAHITATLRETNWVVGGPRGAAAQLGLPRTTLIARMQRLKIPAQRSIQSNQEYGATTHAHSEEADYVDDEDRAYAHSPRLRDDSPADQRGMEAAAGATCRIS